MFPSLQILFATKNGYPYLKNFFGNSISLAALLDRAMSPFNGSFTVQFPEQNLIKNDANAFPKYLIRGIFPNIPPLQNL